MLVTIKTLHQTNFPLDINIDDTILQVKEKISQLEESKNVPVERQKLIHAGKVLENHLKVSDTLIKENDFIVLMTITPKAAPTASKKEDVAQSTTTAPKLSEEQKSLGDNKKSESTLVVGAEYEETVQRLIDMGFSKENVISALKASFNNPERAVEYLTSGVIPSIDEEEVGGRSSGEGRQGAPSNLEFLKQDPQFQQLISMIKQRPALLGPIIEQLKETSPELLLLIEQNADEFSALIADSLGDGEGLMGEGEMEEEYSGEEEIDPEDIPAGAHVIQLTEADQLAIQRLCDLGFDKGRAVEAYFACDKNEEYAANYLFEHLDDN